jgi:hypothetical protein
LLAENELKAEEKERKLEE